jgi:zinc protease
MAQLNLKKYLKIYSKELKNGLKTVLLPIKKSPVICVNIAYKVGSKDEKFNRTGMAHLFEHLMFEGTKNVSKGEFDKLCSIAGGSNNAYTSFDITNYHMSLPSNQLDLGLWLESDRMQNFRITRKALKNQQDVVIEEINQNVEDEPYGLWNELMSKKAYSRHSSYSWEVYGKKEHIASVTLDDAENFRKMFYQPANAHLVITGDINPDKTFDSIEHYFGNIKKFRGKIKRNKFDEKHLVHNAYDKFNRNVPLPAIFLAFHTNGITDETIYKTDIITNILGQGRSSELFKKLVYQKQIASHAGAFVDKRENSSLLIIYAFANSDKVTCDHLHNEIKNVLCELTSSKITNDEIEKARNQLSTYLAFNIQSTTGLASEIAEFSVFKNEPEKIFDILDIYRKISSKEIREHINRIFKNTDGVRIDAIP